MDHFVAADKCNLRSRIPYDKGLSKHFAGLNNRQGSGIFDSTSK
jgi:hypothetical protein